MNTISPEEFPNLAFQLAYFLHCDRKTAAEIAMRALNKLQLAATAQGKRLYYRLTGRADARKARSKVSMGEPHLLQRLVYVESEEYERRKEAAAHGSRIQTDATPARHADLVVYFIKHLVRITARRNSFYVTLGLSRLLYNYTTPETMELYNLVIQDPDRVHDDYYYRSRKGLLLKELKERFGELVEIAKGVRGEQRWRPAEDNSRDAALARECLLWFTPWATPCVVPEQFNPLDDAIERLNFQGLLPDEEHEVEMNRIHATLHPDCFARLAAANLLSAPHERLELPHFFLANDDDESDSSRTPPNLSEDELRAINNLLAQEAARRKAVAGGFLRVLVDGIQLAELNVEHAPETRFVVKEESEVIEVYAADQQGALLLATHLLNFNGADTENFIITVEGGQRIAFTLTLLRDETGATTGAHVVVAFKETAPARAVALATRRIWASLAAPGFYGWWKPVAALAVLALLSAGAWWVWTNRQKHTEFVRVMPTPGPTVVPAPSVAKPEPVKPKDAEPQRVPEPPVKGTPQTGNGATPAPAMAQRERSTRQRDETWVERSLLLSSGNAEPDEVGTRGAWNRELMGKPLNEVHQIYIQAVASNALSEDLITELRARLTRDQRVRLAGIDQADAALKISVQPQLQPMGRDDNSRIIAIVRVVNPNGRVVWPVSRRSSSWRYVGRPPFVAERIVADLTKDIEGAKRR